MKKEVNAGYPHRGIFSAIKRNEFLTRASAWMHLEHMMLSKISEIHKDKYSKIPLTWDTWSGHICGQKVEWWMSGAGGRRERKVLSVGHIFCQGCGKAQEMGGGDGCTTL